MLDFLPRKKCSVCGVVPTYGHNIRCRDCTLCKTVREKCAAKGCKNSAVKGKKTCVMHANGSKVHKDTAFYKKDFLATMPAHYTECLGPTLAAAFNSLTEKATNVQYETGEELAIVKMSNATFLRRYNEIFEAKTLLLSQRPNFPDTQSEQRIAIEDAIRKLQFEEEKCVVKLREALKDTTEMAERGHNVYMKNADILDVKQIPLIINQIISIIFTACGSEHEEIALRIQEAMTQELHLPGYTPDGRSTTKTIESSLDDMMASFSLDALEVVKQKSLIHVESEQMVQAPPAPNSN